MDYVQVINGDISLKVMTNSLPTKGKLVYEYNPLRNYRLSENKYLYKENYYSLKELKEQFSIFPDSENQNWIGVPATETDPILYEKGQLIDFVTDELKFSISINLPVDGSIITVTALKSCHKLFSLYAPVHLQ